MSDAVSSGDRPPQTTAESLTFLDFKLNLKSGVLYRDGQKIDLPPAEAAVLRHLARHKGNILTKSALEEAAGWKIPCHESRLSQAIKSIRRALGSSPYVKETTGRASKGARKHDDPGTVKKSGARPADEIVCSHYGDGYSFRPPFTLVDFRSEWNRHVNLCGLESLFQCIEKHLDDRTFDRGFILLEGGPGVGKSAALYRWFHAPAPADRLTVYHCIRRGVHGWDQPQAVLQNLLAQLGHGEHDDAVDASPDSLRDVLFNALAARRPALVILDGADELASAPGEVALQKILPTSLPKGVWVCIGTRPGPWVDWLKSVSYVRRIDLVKGRGEHAASREFWELLRRNSSVYANLSAAFIEAAVAASGDNMLYTVLLAQWLASRAPDDPEPDPRSLPVGFESLLGELWAALAAKPGVQDALRVFCLARAPLSSQEISLVLDCEDLDHLSAARPLVLHTGDEYRLFHEALRDFVVKQTPPAERKRLHGRLADTVARWSPGAQRGRLSVVHALYHRTHADRPEALRDLCFDREYLVERMTADRPDRDATLETDLRVAAHYVRDEKLGRELSALHAAFRRQSYWLRSVPKAAGELLQTALRNSGWSVRDSSFALLPGDRPHAILQHPIQHDEEPVRSLPSPGSATWDCCINSAGDRAVAVAFPDPFVWNLVDGTAHPLGGHMNMTLGCAMSPDGTRAATGGLEGIVRLWDLDRCERLHEYSVHSTVGRLAFVGNDRLAIPCWDGTIALWTAGEAKDLRMRGHTGPVLRCTVNSGATRLLSASSDGTLRLWDLETHECQSLSGRHQGPVLGCALTADSRYAVSGGRDDVLRVWDLSSGGCIREARARQGGVNHCIFMSADREIVSAGNDGSIKVWELDLSIRTIDLNEVAQFPGYPLGAYALAACPQRSTLMTGGYDGVARIWDASGGRIRSGAGRHASSVTHCLVMPDGRAVTGSSDCTARVWNLASGRSEFVLRGHCGAIRALTLDPSGRLLATGAEDGTVRVWDLENGQMLRLFEGPERWVTACEFSACGGFLYIASSDGVLQTRSISAEAPAIEVGKAGGITCTAVRGDLLLVGREGDGVLEVRSRSRGSLLRTIPVGAVDRCAISDDANYAVTIGNDKHVRYWDLTRNHEKLLGSHAGVVTDCCFLDSTWVLSSAADCTIRRWSTEGAKGSRAWYGTSPFLCVAVEGRSMVAGDFAGNVWFFELTDNSDGGE